LFAGEEKFKISLLIAGKRLKGKNVNKLFTGKRKSKEACYFWKKV
jgi:hypothetical protein